MSVGGFADVDQAGTKLGKTPCGEAALVHMSGSIALHNHVTTVHDEVIELVDIARNIQIKVACQLSEPGIDPVGRNALILLTRHVKHISTLLGQRVADHIGPAMIWVWSRMRTPESGRSAGANGSGALSPIFSMVMTGKSIKALPCGCLRHSSRVRCTAPQRLWCATASSSSKEFHFMYAS